MNPLKRAILLTLFSLTAWTVQGIEYPQGLDYDSLRGIPIQDNGRYKPLDTYAGESLRDITGRWNFEGHDPLGYLLSFMTSEEWYKEKIVRIDYQPLKEALGLDPAQTHFSYNELAANEQFHKLLDRVSEKHSRNEENFSRLENEVSKLYHQLSLFQSIQSGEALSVVPPQGNDEEAAWLSLNHPHGYSAETQDALKKTFLQVLAAVMNQDAASLTQAGSELKIQLAQLNPALYPSPTLIQREISYNQTRPFLNSWIYYMLAFLLLLFSFYFTNPYLYWISVATGIVGFGYHSYGLIIRSLVSGRPPVSNMYESVVFVGWGIILFAIVFELIYRQRWFIITASALGVGMLIMADLLPFDPDIDPLVPVLRSNYWLIIHVLTITLSYSAFALAMGLAHINLGVYFYFPNRRDLLNNLSLFLYRVLQVGVVLLAAGTILGGVWAAESWGRFWGWDPKETWALISLLGYMAILHARFTDWVANFGTAVCSILGFWLILMTWYGVNFVLGTGLHSYGFGSGGGWYVIGYLALEVLFLAAVSWKYMAAQALVREVAAARPAVEPR